MSEQLIISISVDREPEVQCMPMSVNQHGLGLSIHGITWKEESDAILFLNDRRELMIQRMSDQRVVVIRGGRRCLLDLNHPICILADDCIELGNHDLHTFEITRLYRFSKPDSWLVRLSKKAMIASAAALVMSCMACNQPNPVFEDHVRGRMPIDDANADNPQNIDVRPVDGNDKVEPIEMGEPPEEALPNPEQDQTPDPDDSETADNDTGLNSDSEINPDNAQDNTPDAIVPLPEKKR